MSLFEQAENRRLDAVQPLAARMRPRSLDEFVGQEHLLAPNRLLWRLLKANCLGSLILYGPPGTGKTTLARLLALESKRRFVTLSAVTSGVKELREALQDSRDEVATGGQRTLLFVDEIHRFNRTQQDALLPDVEDGIVTLVGATTANPSFAIAGALISRSQVFELQPLSSEEILQVLLRAIEDSDRGLGHYRVEAEPEALQFLAEVCDGDARRALTALEIAVLSDDAIPRRLTRAMAADSVQRKAIQYDAAGDAHYDTASALIKSVRGSDPDAAIYWLGRMLEGGEDIRFVCRRLIILASEDIGNADPAALPLAVAAMQACEFVGLPECQWTLAQTVTYLAAAPKSNAATKAISSARREIREGRVLPVPMHLRDSHYRGAERLGHGQGYEYAHDSDGGIASQDYLGVERIYYQPVDRGFESEIRERLVWIRERLRGADPGPG